MAIKVQGETYREPAELVDEIGKLRAELATMPEGENRTALESHIERLEAALGTEEATEPGAGAETPAEPARRSHVSRSSAPVKPDEDDDAAEQEGAEVVCPLCNGEGTLPTEPPQDPNTYRCQDCDGTGVVFTGSRVPGHETRNCQACQGNGYREKDSAQRATPPEVAKYAPVPEAPGALFDPELQRWNPPEGAQPPWGGAQWDYFYGKWV